MGRPSRCQCLFLEGSLGHAFNDKCICILLIDAGRYHKTKQAAKNPEEPCITLEISLQTTNSRVNHRSWCRTAKAEKHPRCWAGQTANEKRGRRCQPLMSAEVSVFGGRWHSPSSCMHRQGGLTREPWGTQSPRAAPPQWGSAAPHRSLPPSRSGLRAKLPRVFWQTASSLTYRPAVSTHPRGPRPQQPPRLHGDSSICFSGSQKPGLVVVFFCWGAMRTGWRWMLGAGSLARCP